MYLSDLIGLPVRDSAGAPLARLLDLIIRPDFVEPYPPVTGLVARLRRRAFFIPWDQVARADEQGITLYSATVSLEPFRRREGEVLLVRDVLDKQLVDVEGRRVVRANDLQITHRDGKLGIVAVDVSQRAIVRRLLPRRWRHGAEARALIDWTDLEVFAGQLPTVKLKVPHDRLARLHPVDIARIVDALSHRQGAEIVEALDLETAADTLEEMSPARQADILEGMDEERAADILEEMEPDDAADLLADLPEQKAESLLDKMDPEQAEDVRDLMAYEEDTAGGIMTTEIVVVPVELRVGEAMRYLREQAEMPELIYYVYVVDSLTDSRLLGVLSLRDLLLADPAADVSSVMETDLQTARPDDEARDIARTIAEYNLLALPVTDDHGRLLGVVTVDDAMELLLPEGWRRRLPRVFG
ncbi:MAG: magnesium transporter [Chloroflexi bacterium]|nr:magnesium transporter [Chloroflexota bacterium]